MADRDWTAEIDETIDAVSDVSKKAAEDAEKYKPAIAAGIEAAESMKRLFQAMERGDLSKVNACLTQWKNVNKLLAARQMLKEELANPSTGPEWDEVLSVALKVARTGLTVASIFA